MSLLDKVKLNLRLSTDVFDDGEINDLIAAALLDLGLTDISNIDTNDAMITRAVITYCKANFGESDQYERYKACYDELKAMLSMSSRYTDWGE